MQSSAVRHLLNHSACMPDNDCLTDGLIAKPGESFAPLEEIITAYVKEMHMSDGRYGELQIYPDLDLGVVVMGSVSGYHPGWIADNLVRAWMHEK